MIILAIGFGITGISHFFADIISPYIQTNFSYLKNLV